MSSTSIASGPPRTGLTTRSFGAPEGFWGRATVSVWGQDVSGVQVRMQAASAIRGRVVFEGDWPASQPAPFSVAEPTDGDPSRSKTRTWRPGDPADRLLFEGLAPGQYVVRVRSAESWTVKSVLANSRDVTNLFIDVSGSDIDDVVVTMTDKAAAISGTVRGTGSTPASAAVVVVFPSDAAAWSNYGMTPNRIKSTSVSSVGGYRLGGLPAGDYLIVAVDESLLTAWQDPAWLKNAATNATRLSVAWGETKAVDLVKRTSR